MLRKPERRTSPTMVTSRLPSPHKNTQTSFFAPFGCFVERNDARATSGRHLSCAAMASTMAAKALAEADSGLVTTKGRPASEASPTMGSSGMRPRNGMSIDLASASPPPPPPPAPDSAPPPRVWHSESRSGSGGCSLRRARQGTLIGRRGRKSARGNHPSSIPAAAADPPPWPAEKPRRRAAGRNSSGTPKRRSFWAGPVAVGVSMGFAALAPSALPFGSSPGQALRTAPRAPRWQGRRVGW